MIIFIGMIMIALLTYNLIRLLSVCTFKTMDFIMIALTIPCLIAWCIVVMSEWRVLYCGV